MKRQRSWPIALAGLACVALGCSNGGGPTIRGTVTLDGQPLGNAEVVFEPFDRTQSIGGDRAVTDGQGRFEIRPDRRKFGMKPGKYSVYVSRWVDRKTKQPPPPEEMEMRRQGGLLVNQVAPRYSDRDAPAITQEITGKNDDLKIEVKSR